MPLSSVRFAVTLASCLSLVVLSGCERSNDTQDEAPQVTTITPADTPARPSATESKDDVATQAQTKVDKADIDATINTANDAANQTPPSAKNSDGVLLNTDDIESLRNDAPRTSSNVNSKPASQEMQITDVEYRGEDGQTAMVTFQTSVAGELEANVQLPSGKRVVLTAPAGQGNNPTYRSADGQIELVSHGGGGSVDLLQSGQVTSFDAVSAEAEVIGPQ